MAVMVLVAMWLRNQAALTEQGLGGDLEGIYYIGPDEYYLNRAAYLLDEDGQTRLGTVLVPLLPDSVASDTPPTNGGYVGPESCAECHQDYYDGFIETAHARTASLPSDGTIMGSFQPGENELLTASPDLRLEMVKEGEQFFQRMLLENGGESAGADFPIDIVTGSGKVGQTFLYWQGEHLYQLHASYLKNTDSWMNSPGYVDGAADFARPILHFCLECHATYAQPYENTANQFRRDNMILGVTCEKCHGPGQEHVDFHHANPDAEDPHAITNPSSLATERSMELCQLCHGGEPSVKKQGPFQYRAGEPLSDYYEYPENDGSKPMSGVHTNSQLPRLKRSECFIGSEDMGCIDCHNPHQHERGDMRLFSERCLNCHQLPDCGKFELLGDELANNCIDCHMLNVEMSDIRLASGDTEVVPKMRDHYIKVWEDATAAYLKSIGKE